VFIKAYLCRRRLSHLTSSPGTLVRAAPAQLGDQHQDFLEHLSRHRDLGHLKRRVAAVAHDLGADLSR
jgi:hypothetical protein